jgi:hypothetical protein
MVAQTKDLWSVVWGKPQIDPADLADAVQQQAQRDDLDYRTRLLIRDSIAALKDYWGDRHVAEWLAHSPAKNRIQSICGEEFDKVGFPSIQERIVERTDPETVRQFFRELSGHVRSPLRLLVGGSIALIVPGHLRRATEDVDVVDEVPRELREQHELIDGLKKRYGLGLTHFQSHYLPSGWDTRLHHFETFGSMQVYFVDKYDCFLGKTTSARTKDLDDLRMLAPDLDKTELVRRLNETMGSTFAVPELHENAQKNWYIVFGENLPP